MNRADRRDQLLGGHALQQIGARAGLQRAIDVLIAVIGCEHNEARLRRLHADALDHLDAAQARQPQIDQRDIRLVLAKLRDGLHAVRGLAHHLQAFHHVQQRHQPLAHHVMIFHHQHANRFLGHGCSFCSLHLRRQLSVGTGARSRTVVPAPGSLVTSSVPPIAAARSLIPVSP